MKKILTYILSIMILGLFSNCKSTKSGYPYNYPVVHKEKLLNIGYNPNRK